MGYWDASMWNRETAQEERPRAPQTAGPTSPPRPVEERRIVAWVGKSVLFRGDVIGLEDMAIDGRVEGTIELRDHNLTIGPGAHIQADIVAKGVAVLGVVGGTLRAGEAGGITEGPDGEG